MEAVTLKAGEAFVATATSGYPNFNVTLALPDGGVEIIQFKGHTFDTQDSNIANLLLAQAKARGCEWLTEEGCKVVKVEELDPLYALREQIRKEELAKIAGAAATPSTSDTIATGKGMATTASLGEKAIAVAQAAAKSK